MNTFKNINWFPTLEDISDPVFIHSERLQNESAMHRILADDFTDPFKDIDNEYAQVDIDLIKRLGGEELEKEVLQELESTKSNEDKDEMNNEDKETEKMEEEINKTKEIPARVRGEKYYIPGIRKLPFYFPRRSHLNNKQQATCLRVLLRFSGNENGMITEEEKTELQNYMLLQDIICKEQTEFLEFARSKWDKTAILFMKCPGFVKSKWAMKMHRVQELPKYFTECANIPFSGNNDIRLKFVCSLQEESLPQIQLPKLNQREMLSVSSAMLRQRFMPSTDTENRAHYNLPVSEDIYCENLATKVKVDLVISSSGLKCLLNNLDPTYSNTWLIPVVIKSYDGKNIIYVDKRLPPTSATIPQKNTWVYKYILKYYFVDAKDKQLIERENQEELVKDAVQSDDNSECSFDDLLKIAKERTLKKKNDQVPMCSNEGEFSRTSNRCGTAKGAKPEGNIIYLNDDDDDRWSDSTIGCLKIDEDVTPGSDNAAEPEFDCPAFDEGGKNGDHCEINQKSDVSYRLFTIETQSQDYDVRKNTTEYKILFRSKVDGIEVLPDRGFRPLILSAKMEHQLGFGAEAASLEEGLYEWTSLLFRPEASVARVRIEANSAEMIQIERHTMTSLNSEIRRLHNVKPEESLKILHNLIETLSVFSPGRYIVQHVPKYGPFAYVYKETDNIKLKKNCLNLDVVYGIKQFETILSTPWPPIDKMLTTPWIEYCKKMPAMFNPPPLQSHNKNMKARCPKGRSRKQLPKD